MKTVLPLYFILLSSYAVAQERYTFDLLAHTRPEGWTVEEGTFSLEYTHRTQGTYCKIVLFKNVAGSGNSQRDFKNQWEKLVVNEYHPESEVEQVQEQHATEWTINAGTSTFTRNDAASIVMLTTLSDANTLISILFLFDDESYVADIEKFMQSLEIVRPPQSSIQNVTTTSSMDVTSSKPRLSGRWGRNRELAEKSPPDAVGYCMSTYDFKPDGTYCYKQRTFSTKQSAILIARETGIYSASGNSLMIKPSTSTLESYEKKGGADELGRLLTKTEAKLEPLTYRYTFHYQEGSSDWVLVLQADTETQRDGPFSDDDTFINAWYFDQKSVQREIDSVSMR